MSCLLTISRRNQQSTCFLILSERKLTDLILIGGNYRDITGAFVGTLTLQNLSNLQFSKAFVSCNGIQTEL